MPKRPVDKSGDGSNNSSGDVSDTTKTKIYKPSKYFSPKRLNQTFYNQPGEDLAKALLGKKLVRFEDGERLCGIIVETEAYIGLLDKAAHSYNGKRTEKTEAMFMKPGTAYVYHIYGIYCCMNISSQGEGCAVLLRAVEPSEGKDLMNGLRWKKNSDEAAAASSSQTNNKDQTKKKSKLTKKEKDLSNGPSKMCQALNITKKEINKADLSESDDIWLEDADPIPDHQVVISKRININYAEDWTDKLLRFYILDNDFVSVRDKPVENLMKTK